MDLEKLTKQELIEECERLKLSRDRVFQIASHDLRSPFGGLLGVTAMLSEELDSFSGEELQKFVSTVHETLKNTYRLLENLFEWGSIERQKYEKRIESIPFKLLLDEVLLENKDQFEAKEIEIVFDFNDELILKTNSKLLEFVLKNFVSNAVKYSDRGSRVLIGVRERDAGSEILVTDYGVGISKDNLKKLFKPDVSWKMIGTEGEGGTGLGLLASSRFAEYFNARIAVDSEEGKGSTFSLILSEPPV